MGKGEVLWGSREIADAPRTTLVEVMVYGVPMAA